VYKITTGCGRMGLNSSPFSDGSLRVNIANGLTDYKIFGNQSIP
jgi:hypothetical protein